MKDTKSSIQIMYVAQLQAKCGKLYPPTPLSYFLIYLYTFIILQLSPQYSFPPISTCCCQTVCCNYYFVKTFMCSLISIVVKSKTSFFNLLFIYLFLFIYFFLINPDVFFSPDVYFSLFFSEVRLLFWPNLIVVSLKTLLYMTDN